MIEVSVIMPTYNAELTVSRSVESILNQSYRNFELLIIDDNSEDSTLEILSRYEKNDERISIFPLKKNTGAGLARNLGLDNARGRYIAFCDSDDEWLPRKLELQLAHMKSKRLSVSWTSYDVYNSNNEFLRRIHSQLIVGYNELLYENKIGMLTAVFDSHIHGHLRFNSLRKRQDWLFWLQLFRDNPKAEGLLEVLAIYNITEGSLSSKKSNLIKYTWRVYYLGLNYGIIRSCYTTLIFLIKHTTKILTR